MAIPTNIPAGFVRSYRGNPAEHQEAALRAHGILTIYRAKDGETPAHTKGKLRRTGELLGVYGGLRALGEKRSEVVDAVGLIHAAGYAVIDILTGERSDRNGVAMMDKAWKTFNAERRVPDLKKAAEYGAAGGVERGRRAQRGRLAKHKALAYWRRKTLTAAEALELMHGWTREVAYERLGPRGVRRGRPTR